MTMPEAFPTPYTPNTSYATEYSEEDDLLASLLSSSQSQHRPSSRKNSVKSQFNHNYNSINGSNSNLSQHPNSTPLRRARSLTESIANSVIYVTNATVKKMRRQRFLSSCLIGVCAVFLFNLIFLPRTSLDRDLRRLHGEFLTFDDCQRLLLTHLNFKNHVRDYIIDYEDELHIPGENYENILETFKNFKFKTSTDKYETWMNKPIDNWLKLYSSKNDELIYEATLKETDLLTFHPYSANGTAKAEFLFVNYATQEDFLLLQDNQVSPKGKIVIARTGKIHTSLKIKNSHSQGALAVLLYHDPYDDGKFTTDDGFKPYPYGPASSPFSINKQTTNFIIEQPGDPTTPGWSSTLFSHRIKPQTIPKIPSIPISYFEIQHILKHLNEGPDLGWVGNVDEFGYLPGPSKDFYLDFGNLVQFKIKPIYNIINEITGVMKDEEVIIGANRDIIGGIGGANLGHASLLELSRGFNELVKLGWKPLRTIKLISWDGSSYGMLGSTEFGEFYSSRLSGNTIVYVNLDKVEGNLLNIESNPLFNNLINKLMKKVMVNETLSLHDFFKKQDGKVDLISKQVLDYSIFQNHIGIPSLNIGFKNDPLNNYVPYENSKFTDMNWLYQIDKKMKFHNLIAQFVGLFVLNLTEQEILHIKTLDYVLEIQSNYNKILKKVPDYWKDRLIDEDDPSEVRLNHRLSKINNLFDNLLNKTIKFDNKLDQLQQDIIQDYPWFKLFVKFKIAIQVKVANLKVKALDRLFIHNNNNDEIDILDKRPWFKHLIFAPDRFTGMDVVVLPGLVESIEDLNFELFVVNLKLLNTALLKLYLKI